MRCIWLFKGVVSTGPGRVAHRGSPLRAPHRSPPSSIGEVPAAGVMAPPTSARRRSRGRTLRGVLNLALVVGFTYLLHRLLVHSSQGAVQLAGVIPTGGSAATVANVLVAAASGAVSTSIATAASSTGACLPTGWTANSEDYKLTKCGTKCAFEPT